MATFEAYLLDRLQTLTAEAETTRGQIDDLRRRGRPEYPTPDMVHAVAITSPAFHHKTAAPDLQTTQVWADPEAGIVQFIHDAPDSLTTPGEPLWDFADHEVAAIERLLSDFDLQPGQQTRTQHGLQFRVTTNDTTTKP